MDDIASANLPLLVGEFGHSHGDRPVQWETIIARSNANAQGYAPWLWFGDTEFPVLNMNESWDGPLTSWGNDVLPLGGVTASIFE